MPINRIKDKHVDTKCVIFELPETVFHGHDGLGLVAIFTAVQSIVDTYTTQLDLQNVCKDHVNLIFSTADSYAPLYICHVSEYMSVMPVCQSGRNAICLSVTKNHTR